MTTADLSVQTASTEPVRIAVNDVRHALAYEWLMEEAFLLDAHDYQGWLRMLTEDISYRVPTRWRREGGNEGESSDFGHYVETRSSLETRVRRMTEPTAWAARPLPTTRHIVTNVRVQAAGEDLLARSYLLLICNRGSRREPELITGERHDRLRVAADGLQLGERTVLLDQSSVMATSLSVFL
jgi:3-phenylpropionate/cinnamic acid dioxygenase small subunit